MFARVTGLCWALVVVWASLASAQVPRGALPLDGPLGPDVVAAKAPDLARDVAELKKAVDDLAKNLTATLDVVHAQGNRLADIKQELDSLKTSINNSLTQQQQILDAISQRDSAGRAIPRLSANMDASPDFRKDVEDAVHKSLRNEGTLSVVNKTGTYQRIYVNRVEFGVQPGQTQVFKVPVGTVTTQIPGRDMMTWTVNAPVYKQDIDIVPPTDSQPIYHYSPVLNAPATSSPSYMPYSYSYPVLLLP